MPNITIFSISPPKLASFFITHEMTEISLRTNFQPDPNMLKYSMTSPTTPFWTDRQTDRQMHPMNSPPLANAFLELAILGKKELVILDQNAAKKWSTRNNSPLLLIILLVAVLLSLLHHELFVPIYSFMKTFRLSNHKLMIEKGRHSNNIESCNRFSPFCPNFLICPAYSSIRLTLLNQTKSIQRTDTTLLFIFLMTENLIANHTAEFNSNANDIRDLLLKNTSSLAWWYNPYPR